ncbi:hypothetical protein OV203_37100 [Nannocystis sp. ILAH1]|uniref:sigma-70 family RNA polymerase sigma factor n=1 Tax=Nannocystis sp. ILAH1 TaxID=2996789 RepID=UPI0022709C12|nr:sigma factor [Nannocystis sp. ILAH1]MCY0992818.1 hypothetical protein [Nannocystis sp. ILAH1]
MAPHAGPRLESSQVQAAARAYDEARLALWRALLAGARAAAFRRALREAQPDGPFAGGSRSSAAVRSAGRAADPAFRASAPLARKRVELDALARARQLRDRLTLGCLGLAASFARAHRGAGHGGGRGLSLVARGDDAIQAALEHLLLAIDRFEPERGVRFSSFAGWYLRRGVQQARLDVLPTAINLSALAAWGKIEDEERALRHQLGREPTDDELVARIGSASKVATARATAAALAPVVDADERELSSAVELSRRLLAESAGSGARTRRS